MPDPELAARRFASACERGDADAVRALLDEETQRRLDRAAVAALLQGDRQEQLERCRALAREPLHVDASASLRFASGESAELVVEDGQPRVRSAGALPGGGATPEQALVGLRVHLRRELDRGSFGVFSEETQQRSQARAEALMRGLDEIPALRIEARGDRADVQVPEGHLVRLVRREGLWRVESYE